MNIELTKEEANALLQLIDIAIKSGGDHRDWNTRIQVAKAGVVLSEKILSEASKQQTNPQPE